ncbi:hypothetical protein Slin15195_G111260 [Septoria linicola]|uniref:Uncharacterized protein n=1 Tax=Septoria linicola TaxID=215465 RepID=A0A9Q9B5M5_9PEZI|nr:hypothetical protein Slin15195_G111260 [Septoria linicola]
MLTSAILTLLLLQLSVAAPEDREEQAKQLAQQNPPSPASAGAESLSCVRPLQLSVLLESFVPPDKVTPQLASYYECQGRALLNLMLQQDSSKLDIFESLFGPNDIRRGWIPTEKKEKAITDLSRSHPGLEGLDGVEGFNKAEFGVTFDEPVEWMHEVMDSPRVKKAYRNILSGEHRFIVSVISKSTKLAVPAEEAGSARQEHTIKRWSDVTFLQYARCWVSGEFGPVMNEFIGPATPGVEKPVPNWILLQDFEKKAKDLVAMSGYCLQIIYKQRLGAWPGITFPAGSLCYYYLLGTDTSTEVANFYIRYRKIIGPAALGSVTVFLDRDGKMNLLWWATNNAQDLQRLRGVVQQNSASDRAALAARKWTPNWPFPMKPTRE